jgi:hypothetical protein
MTNSELREGNIVYHNGGLVAWNVFIIAQECEPVSLSHNMFKSMGFVLEESAYLSTQTSDALGAIGFQMKIHQGYYWEINPHLRVHLSYLHELQNLYYAVCKLDLKHNLIGGKRIFLFGRQQ